MPKAGVIRLMSLAVLACTFILAAYAGAADKQVSEPQVREAYVYESVVATVKAVDLAKREVILVLPEGREFTLVADPRIQRLAEVKPGDKVKAEYFISLAAEMREPTAQELASPLEVVVGEVKAKPKQAPAGAALRQIRAVVTVAVIDKPGNKVTVEGPRGNRLEIAVADPTVYSSIKLGQKVLMTFTEALALSVEKVK